ncbi:MAG: zinc metallopeptidase, partial [Clostridiales bacterium]|nr:zinc metallopeptidase [Clostridiales bacterium]
DPRTKVVKLSQAVYNSTSLAALGVAAHESGHAMQDNEEYLPLKIRSAIVPVAQFGSNASWIFIILGIFLGNMGFIQAGILVFTAVVLFQLVTLPVEYNASSRAVAALEGGGYLTREETPQAQKVLSAAALTYVAAALVAVLQLLRLILIFGRRN